MKIWFHWTFLVLVHAIVWYLLAPSIEFLGVHLLNVFFVEVNLKNALVWVLWFLLCWELFIWEILNINEFSCFILLFSNIIWIYFSLLIMHMRQNVNSGSYSMERKDITRSVLFYGIYQCNEDYAIFFSERRTSSQCIHPAGLITQYECTFY